MDTGRIGRVDESTMVRRICGIGEEITVRILDNALITLQTLTWTGGEIVVIQVILVMVVSTV